MAESHEKSYLNIGKNSQEEKQLEQTSDTHKNDICCECIFVSVVKRHQICKICQVYYLGNLGSV